MEKVDFSQPLANLHVIGMHPFKESRFARLRQSFSLLIYVFIMSSGILEIITNPGLKTYARASDTIVPQCQLVAKMVVLIVYKKELKTLLTSSENFWSLDKFGAGHGELVHRFLRYFYWFYQVSITFTCCQFMVVKIIYKSRQPVAISYGETGEISDFYDIFYMVVHTLITLISINLLNGFDGLFFFFIGHILSELQMVKMAFSQCEISMVWDNKTRFRNAVKHHSHVLQFIKASDGIFSVVLLVQHLSGLFGICFGLFLMSKDGMPPQSDLASKYLPYILSFILQIWTFCFAGHLLIDWIPDTIFYHDWKGDYQYQNVQAKVVAMMRGQRAAKLTLGGFGNLDLASFKLVMQKSFSFFTFINTMIEKKNMGKQ